MEQQTVSDVTPSSSPAPSTPISAQAVLDGMSDSQRTQWELTGNLPDATSPGSSPDAKDRTAAASSPATAGEQPASTDAKTAAASEPATTQKPQGHKGNAETRLQELLSERTRDRDTLARLQGQLDALMRTSARSDAPAASSTAPPTEAEYERYLAMPNAPKFEDFEEVAATYAEAVHRHSAAMSLFITDQRWSEHQTRANADAQVQRQMDAVLRVGEAGRAQLQEFIKTDPEFVKSVDTRLLEIEPASVRQLSGQPVGPQHVIAEELLHSDVRPHLMRHFSTPEGQQDWARLAQTAVRDLGAFQRAFGRLEERFGGSQGVTATASQTPPPKTLSTAPPPSTTLGSRPVEPIDPSEAALKRGDYLGFEAAENAKELARLRA